MASIEVGLDSFNAFLQANVTGPVLTEAQAKLAQPFADEIDLRLQSLDVDGVSVYPFIPHIDLFCVARHVFHNVATQESWNASSSSKSTGISLPWMRLRLLVWHYKLFIQPSLSSAAFTKHTGMSEVPTLVEQIQEALSVVEADVVSEAWEITAESKWGMEAQVRFLVEKANVCIMLGRDAAAREALGRAAEAHGFSYALSGALGKRTRFQEKSTSQLVVLAKSRTDADDKVEGDEEEEQVPEALPLNDDTLLEEIQYGGEGLHGEADAVEKALLPAPLRNLKPDEQPPLNPLDQIILLTEATLKDAFSPLDALTSEEVLPFAVRVIGEKGANWQIYTQALLVRSRIEMHRSRTVERGVLQMQAVVDQVIVDTTAKNETEAPSTTTSDKQDIPAISFSGPDEEVKEKRDREEAAPVEEKPISFFPAAKSTESAPAATRLEYIHALSSPPRWHLESELAYAWTGVGSLISALEIFKRLKLWAEVALCLASSASTDNEDGSGRGGGGEDKARAIIRWRLFHHHTNTEDEIDEETDISTLKAADFTGPERIPPQPNAPRLFCILGDIESDAAVAHYERAWEVSKHRYARAQKSLAEHYLAKKDWIKAREAYQLAVSVNRLSPEMWSRLGDINLRLGEFSEAAESFTRAIGSSNDTAGGEDARTWSNLGSALYSMYQEVIEKEKKGIATNGSEVAAAPVENGAKADDEEEDDQPSTTKSTSTKDPSILLAQSMNAYKRGASIAHDNWRIWDNVITLAARMRPMPFFEIIQAQRAILRIRKTEDALDVDMLRVLLTEGVLAKEIPPTTSGIYEPPRGTVERNMNEMLETDIVPLITHRSDLWELLARLRAWRHDYAGAVDASEKAWRAAVGGAGPGLSVDDAKKDEAAARRNWLENEEAWLVVVQRTQELVVVLEKYGSLAEEVGDKWRGKARSAVRSVMGKGKEAWEGTEGWMTLKALLDGLKA